MNSKYLVIFLPLLLLLLSSNYYIYAYDSKTLIYGGPNDDRGYSITDDGTNLYITGVTDSEGSGNWDVLVMKLDNNLNLISKKIYGGPSDDSGSSIASDGTNLYITGDTISEGSGNYDVLVMKLDNNLNLISKKIYGGPSQDGGYSITSDGTNLYITGDTYSEGSGSRDVLVMKLDNNLNLISKKIYGGPNDDRGFSITSDGTNLYITGETCSEGSGSRDVLVMKLDNNLNLISKKIYGGPNDDSGFSITSDGTNLYITGVTNSEGSGNYDVLVWRLSKDLDSYVNTTNTSFNYLNSNLVYNNSNLTYSDSNLVFGDSSLIFQDSNLTGNMNYQNSNLIFSYFVLNSTQVSTSKPSNVFPFSCDKNYLMVLLGLVLYLIVS